MTSFELTVCVPLSHTLSMLSLAEASQRYNFEVLPHQEQLKILMDGFCEQVAKIGISVHSTPSDRPFERYQSLPIEKQTAILACFQKYYQICESAIGDGIELEDDRNLAWWMLSKLKFSFDSKLFEHLEKNDTIEIYNADSIQIFRTFNFFKIISYSLEELFTHEWWELYQRPSFVNTEMFKAGDKILKGTEGIIFGCVEPHYVEETFSPQRYRALIEERLLAPVFQNGAIAGFVHAFQVKKVVSLATNPDGFGH